MAVTPGRSGETASAAMLGVLGSTAAANPSDMKSGGNRAAGMALATLGETVPFRRDRAAYGLRRPPAGNGKLGFASVRASEEEPMSARYLLLLVIVLYVIFVLFVPAMQSLLGYGFGTLVALVILWYVFFNNRGGRVL